MEPALPVSGTASAIWSAMSSLRSPPTNQPSWWWSNSGPRWLPGTTLGAPLSSVQSSIMMPTAGMSSLVRGEKAQSWCHWTETSRFRP